MKNILHYRRNRLSKRAISARKRSFKLGVKGYFTRTTIENLYAKQRGKCACCGQVLNGVFEVDHIIPLSRGGSNFPDNLQLLTPFCNKRKGSKTMEDFVNGNV